ncbi:MAG: hypothetical protein P8Y62_04750, partial [candidate division WOR-3 bacterium]
MITKQICFRQKIEIILALCIFSSFSNLPIYSMPLDEFNQAKDLIIEDPPGALEAFNKIIK